MQAGGRLLRQAVVAHLPMYSALPLASSMKSSKSSVMSLLGWWMVATCGADGQKARVSIGCTCMWLASASIVLLHTSSLMALYTGSKQQALASCKAWVRRRQLQPLWAQRATSRRRHATML